MERELSASNSAACRVDDPPPPAPRPIRSGRRVPRLGDLAPIDHTATRAGAADALQGRVLCFGRRNEPGSSSTRHFDARSGFARETPSGASTSGPFPSPRTPPHAPLTWESCSRWRTPPSAATLARRGPTSWCRLRRTHDAATTPRPPPSPRASPSSAAGGWCSRTAPQKKKKREAAHRSPTPEKHAPTPTRAAPALGVARAGGARPPARSTARPVAVERRLGFSEGRPDEYYFRERRRLRRRREGGFAHGLHVSLLRGALGPPDGRARSLERAPSRRRGAIASRPSPSREPRRRRRGISSPRGPRRAPRRRAAHVAIVGSSRCPRWPAARGGVERGDRGGVIEGACRWRVAALDGGLEPRRGRGDQRPEEDQARAGAPAAGAARVGRRPRRDRRGRPSRGPTLRARSRRRTSLRGGEREQMISPTAVPQVARADGEGARRAPPPSSPPSRVAKTTGGGRRRGRLVASRTPRVAAERSKAPAGGAQAWRESPRAARAGRPRAPASESCLARRDPARRGGQKARARSKRPLRPQRLLGVNTMARPGCARPSRRRSMDVSAPPMDIVSVRALRRQVRAGASSRPRRWSARVPRSRRARVPVTRTRGRSAADATSRGRARAPTSAPAPASDDGRWGDVARARPRSQTGMDRISRGQPDRQSLKEVDARRGNANGSSPHLPALQSLVRPALAHPEGLRRAAAIATELAEQRALRHAAHLPAADLEPHGARDDESARRRRCSPRSGQEATRWPPRASACTASAKIARACARFGREPCSCH